MSKIMSNYVGPFFFVSFLPISFIAFFYLVKVWYFRVCIKLSACFFGKPSGLVHVDSNTDRGLEGVVPAHF